MFLCLDIVASRIIQDQVVNFTYREQCGNGLGGAEDMLSTGSIQYTDKSYLMKFSHTVDLFRSQ